MQDHRPKNIFFAAMKTGASFESGYGELHGVINNYDKVEANEGHVFSGQNGKFKVPVAGWYALTVSATSGSEKHQTYVSVFKNEFSEAGRYQTFWDGNTLDRYNSLSGSWVMKLDQGDEVFLAVTTGKLRVTSVIFVNFTGYLIKADE